MRNFDGLVCISTHLDPCLPQNYPSDTYSISYKTQRCDILKIKLSTVRNKTAIKPILPMALLPKPPQIKLETAIRHDYNR